MNLLELLGAQLTDPFRIALMIGLLVTANNTAAQVGRLIPIALGIVFVAVLIPSTFGTEGQPMTPAIGVGIIANALIFAVCWLVLRLVQRKASSM